MNARQVWMLGRPTARRGPAGRVLLMARVVAAAVAVSRIVRAARRRPPLTAAPAGVAVDRSTVSSTISIVVPARDEALRIGPLLQIVCGAPGVAEVVVVDDQSSDATAAIAAAAGARVIVGASLPAGWVGKAWALQQGVLADQTTARG